MVASGKNHANSAKQPLHDGDSRSVTIGVRICRRRQGRRACCRYINSAGGEGYPDKAARAFYQFWNTGDETLLKQAIAPNFTDRTLPEGRPQGPQGPAFASHQFRAAVPDLGVEVKKMIVASDYVTVHMVFTGCPREHRRWYSPVVSAAVLLVARARR